MESPKVLPIDAEEPAVQPEEKLSAQAFAAPASGGSPDDAAELPPTESGSRSINTSHVQGQLAKLQDCTQLRKLEKELASKCLWSQLQRLKELRHKDTCHTWLFHLNPLKGSVMTEGDYVVNVQKRLGAKMSCLRRF